MLSEILRAFLGLPPGITVVLVVLVGSIAAAPKILGAFPQILRALTERRVAKAIRTEKGALTALQILQSAALTAPRGSARRSGRVVITSVEFDRVARCRLGPDL